MGPLCNLLQPGKEKTMTLFIASISAAGGFAFCWLAKDKITVLVTGTEAFIRALEVKAAALKAAL
jgi:hypothetical protein